jgi:hypothetical protein
LYAYVSQEVRKQWTGEMVLVNDCFPFSFQFSTMELDVNLGDHKMDVIKPVTKPLSERTDADNQMDEMYAELFKAFKAAGVAGEMPRTVVALGSKWERRLDNGQLFFINIGTATEFDMSYASESLNPAPKKKPTRRKKKAEAPPAEDVSPQALADIPAVETDGETDE